MNLQVLTGVVKRLESLVAMAMRRASAGNNAFLAARNDMFATNSGGAIAPATTVQWSGGAFTPTLTGAGKVKLRAMMTVSIAGATSAAGEIVRFQLIKTLTPLVGGPLADVELSATHGLATATIVWEDSGLTPGVPVISGYGIQATNLTNGAHTLGVPINEAVIEVEERP